MAAVAKLRHMQFDGSGAGFSGSVAKAVALIDTDLAALAVQFGVSAVFQQRAKGGAESGHWW